MNDINWISKEEWFKQIIHYNANKSIIKCENAYKLQDEFWICSFCALVKITTHPCVNLRHINSIIHINNK
jgi:hypothetical protein